MVSLRSLAKSFPATPPGSPWAAEAAFCAAAAAMDPAATVEEGLQAALEAMAASSGPALALHLRTGGDRGFRCAAAVGPAWDRIPRPQYHALLDLCLTRQAPLRQDAGRYGLPGGGTLLGLALRHHGQDLAVLLAVFPTDPGEAEGRALRALASLLTHVLAASDLRAALARREGLDREVELAAEIQRGLLPESDLGRCPVIGLNRPVRRVSGDFYDFFWLDEQRVAFALGDVSGKGINAALLMAKTAGLFRCLAKGSADPAELLRRVNRELCETASRGMFVTMVAGVYDQATGRALCANAGHEPLLLRSPDRCYSTFPAASPPLGIAPEFAPACQEILLEGGELYLFSDGLTEFRYGSREALGVKGLVQMIESLAELPLDARLLALLSELDHEGWEARDDLTVLAIDDNWVRR